MPRVRGGRARHQALSPTQPAAASESRRSRQQGDVTRAFCRFAGGVSGCAWRARSASQLEQKRERRRSEADLWEGSNGAGAGLAPRRQASAKPTSAAHKRARPASRQRDASCHEREAPAKVICVRGASCRHMRAPTIATCRASRSRDPPFGARGRAGSRGRQSAHRSAPFSGRGGLARSRSRPAPRRCGMRGNRA